MSDLSGNLLTFLFGVLLPLWVLYWIWKRIFKQFRKHYSPAEGKAPGPGKKTGLVVWLVLKAFVVMVLLLFFAAVLGADFIFQGPLLLIFGWVRFLIEKIPQITPNWEGMAMALTSLTLLAVGSHWFLRWLYSHWGPAQDSASPRLWPMRWTLSLVALLFLFFSASIGFIGATHQTAWMIGTNESLVQSSWMDRHRHSDVKSNLHNMYMACKVFWREIGSEQNCSVEIARQDQYGYQPSPLVVLRGGGRQADFHAVAGHLKSGRWFWINPVGKIFKLEENRISS